LPIETTIIQTFGALGAVLVGLWGVYKVLWRTLEARYDDMLTLYTAELDRQRAAIAEQVQERKDLNERFIGVLEAQAATTSQVTAAFNDSWQELASAMNAQHEQMLNVLTAIERRLNGS